MEPKISFSFTANNNNIQVETKKKNNVMEYDFSTVNKFGDVFALAKAFLSISKMTNKKLQKLCYYAKA